MKVEGHHTADELQDLLPRERRASVAIRIRIVRQAALGGTAPQIALECGLSRRSVQEWVERYNTQGLPGL
ncbi:helix-turn-helix domain-containing protein [Planctopirus ephydatiae]|uniref:helix-turn-helix domain-containing protein n=1 Tax=Planctopirus ephydatiae TaxID=2528019 RepID=UPI0011A9D0F6